MTPPVPVFDTGRVPPGRGLVKIEGTMPYALKQGASHWDEIKEDVAAAVMSRYMAHTANITEDKILAKMLFQPARYRAQERQHVARQRAWLR